MNPLLLGDPSPSLRLRAAVEIGGASDDDAEVAAWREEIARSAGVRDALAALAATRGHPQRAGYALCRLAYLGYTGPETAGAAEAIFSSQQADGSWPLQSDDEPKPKAKLAADRAPKPKAKLAADRAPRPKAKRRGATGALSAEPYSVVTMQTLLPLRGVAAAGFATDPRAERAYEWLLGQRLDNGAWTGTHRGGYGFDFRATGGGDPAYRRLARGLGCRSATTGAVACLALHPDRCRSDAARTGVDHLLARESREDANAGWEVARLTGLERAGGRATFYVTHDAAFMLDLASRCGVSPDDRRVRDLVDHVESLRGPYGLWRHPSHPQLSRWLTFDLECSLRRLADGDWVGDERPADAQPPARRRRY